MLPDPMQDEETAVTNLLLEQRRGFLGNLQAQLGQDHLHYLFVKRSSTSTLRNQQFIGTMFLGNH